MRSFLHEIWDERSEPAGNGGWWCRPLTPSQVQRTIMLSVAHHPDAALDALEGPLCREGEPVRDPLRLPGLNGPITAEYRQAAAMAGKHLRGDGWELVVRLTGIAQNLATTTLAGLPQNERRVVSLWAAGMVGRWFRDHRTLPAAPVLAEGRDEFLRTRATAQEREELRLTDQEMTATYRAVYDQLWSDHGTESLQALSPVALGLGRYERPPWHRSATVNWRHGTDRSVLSRYDGYFDSRSWVRDPERVAAADELDPRRHIGARLLTMDADTVVLTELRRTCAPIGLCVRGHPALVASVAHGVREADLRGRYGDRRSNPGRRPPDPRPSLNQWCTARPDLGTDVDLDLVAAVARYAEQWAAQNDWAPRFVEGLARAVRPDGAARGKSSGEPLLDGGADDAGGLDWHIQVELGVPRRLWGHVHGREVEWEEPFRRGDVTRLIRQVFQQSMLDLCERPIDDTRDAPSVEADFQARLDESLRRIRDYVDQEAGARMIALLMVGDPAWEPIYLDIVSAPSKRAVGCLSLAEFRSWAAGHLGDGGAAGGA